MSETLKRRNSDSKQGKLSRVKTNFIEISFRYEYAHNCERYLCFRNTIIDFGFSSKKRKN